MNNGRPNVIVTKTEEKTWAAVTVWGRATFWPSFEDLFRIVQAICYCEDKKYPEGEGRGMVKRFLIDACEKVDDRTVLWEQLKQKYQIPGSGEVDPRDIHDAVLPEVVGDCQAAEA